MLKQIITAILFLALFSQSFNRAVIVTSYYTNTAAWARNCENKARPQMHCNGRCQMMKKLKQEDKKEQQNPDRKNDNKDEVIVSSKSFFPVLAPAALDSPNGFLVFNAGQPVKMPRFILRPPGC